MVCIPRAFAAFRFLRLRGSELFENASNGAGVIVRNVAVDIDRVLAVCNRTQLRSSLYPQKTPERGSIRVLFHLHSEIIKEDALFRFDAVPLARGQVELRVRFSIMIKIQKLRPVFW